MDKVISLHPLELKMTRTLAPRRPERVYLSGENRYERSPNMEAPPVYSKDDAPPTYHETVGSPSTPALSRPINL